MLCEVLDDEADARVVFVFKDVSAPVGGLDDFLISAGHGEFDGLSVLRGNGVFK